MSITQETTITEISTIEKLSIRARNVCRQYHIDTIGDLLNYSSEWLQRFPNCGPKSSAELANIINKYRDVPRSAAEGPEFYALLGALPLALEQWRAESSGAMLSIVSGIFDVESIGKLISDIICDREKFCFRIYGSYSGHKPYILLDNVLEFCNVWQQHIEHIIDSRSLSLDAIIEILKARNDRYLELRLFHALPQSYREALQEEFALHFAQLSVRTRNAFRSFASCDDAMNLLGSETDIESLRLKGCGAKSRMEYKRFLDVFSSKVLPLVSAPRHMLVEHLQGFLFISMSNKFPFLSAEECSVLVRKRLENRELPWIDLFIKYIRRSSSRDACAYRLVYGFGSDNVELSLDEAGRRMGISSERVRQLSQSALGFPAVLASQSRQILKYIDSPFMPDYLDVWQKIKANEEIDGEIDARRLMAVVCAFDDSYTIVSLSPDSPIYLVKKELLRNVRIMTTVRGLIKRYNMRKNCREEFSIVPFVRLSKPPRSFHPDVHLIFPIFLDFMKTLGDVIKVRSPFVVMKSNKLSVDDCLCKILENRGSSMRYDEICDEFVSRYPEFKLNNTTTLRSYILRSSKILPVGRSGRYVLAHWKEIFTGSLTEFMIKCLRDSQRPMSLSQLYKNALKFFPDTTEKSMSTLIYLDKGKNFVSLGTVGYGLKELYYPDVLPATPRSVSRLPFEQRFEQVKDFVAKNQRMPMNLNPEESTLSHWLENVEAGNIFYTEEQWERFRKFRRDNEVLPQSSGELRFRENCSKVKKIVEQTGCLPSVAKNQFEYSWLCRNKHLSSSVDPSLPDSRQPDNRSRYYADLLRFLEAHGIKKPQ